MRIGVIEILKVSANRGAAQRLYARTVIRQYASVMPQAVSVWCRALGHEVHYATYYGQTDPRALLPDGLDLVFVATYTQASALAYALAKLWRAQGTLTVIGGHHAKAFPEDCLRFFDVVVLECDKTLVRELLDDLPRGRIVTSGRPLVELPSVEERLPEIARAHWDDGQPGLAGTVPLLSSTGCPYACDFCVDARVPYRVLPLDRLEADLRFLRRHHPRATVTFHDPNFAVRFDELLDVLERVPRGGQRYYAMESSLAVLKQPRRLERLRDSGCRYVAPGVESFGDYADKSGLRGLSSPRAGLAAVAEHLALIHRHVPGIQANYMLGLDSDVGREPLLRLKEIMDRTPFVWSVVNVPMPFGATPLYDSLRASGRILETLPFHFYYKPFLALRLLHYGPLEYYGHLVEVFGHMVSAPLVARRLAATPGVLRVLHGLRTYHAWRLMRACRAILQRLQSDRALRAFHEGEASALPAFYEHVLAQDLGPYAQLLSPEDLRPLLPMPGVARRAPVREAVS